MLLCEVTQGSFVSPSVVTDFDDKRVLAELVEQFIKVIAIAVRVLERDRELQQQGAQHILAGDRIQASLGELFVFGAYLDGLRRRALNHCNRRMGKGPVELRGEQEPGIHGARFAAPQLSPFGFDVAVERGIDLEHVEVARHVLDGVVRLFDLRRIDDAFPVLVRPARSSHVDVRLRCHSSRRLAQRERSEVGALSRNPLVVTE